jgi:hypothetical protein
MTNYLEANMMHEEDLVKLIRQRYPLNRPDGYQKYIVLEQVPDATGYAHGRWIDVVVFDLWPSKGLLRSAFEIKVSRGDFLREIANPVKYKWAVESFHEFWFVAPQDVIKIEELPANVGWLFPRAGKLAIKRRAVQNLNPRLDDTLLAAFMRAGAKEISRVTKVTSKEILENSEEYQLANRFKEAVRGFTAKRGLNKFESSSLTVDEIVTWLEEASLDNQLKQDRDHLLEIAGRFQREVVSLLNIFLVVAKKSLFARNELGSYIVQTYGGEDRESVETLKALARHAKAFDSEKRYVEVIEVILNWDKEFGNANS